MARLKVAGVTILTCPESGRVSELLGGRIQGEKILIVPTLKKVAARPSGRKRTARAKRSSARKRR